jgi:orotidine-5'-phosphate decarboxylase
MILVIRPVGAEALDQKTTMTPAAAIAAGGIISSSARR